MSSPSRASVIYLLAALQWGILAPLNLVKILMNKASPYARNWVPAQSEQCQANCGIARMWGTLFWACQICFSVGYLQIYLHNKGKTPFVTVGMLQKSFVALLLLKNYRDGVVKWPIACGGILDIVMLGLLAYDMSKSTVVEETPKLENANSDLDIISMKVIELREELARRGLSTQGLKKDLQDRLRNDTASKQSESVGKTSGSESFFGSLKAFATSWWYPWIVGAISGLNTFTIFLSGPLVGLYLAGVFAHGKRKLPITAIANAFGTAAGIGVLIYLVELNGTEFVTDRFPQMFANQGWEKTQNLVKTYGFAGAAAVSAMPIVLQPLVLFSLMAKMNPMVLLVAIFIGRCFKYWLMGRLAMTAPHLLKFFGSAAVKAAEKEGKQR